MLEVITMCKNFINIDDEKFTLSVFGLLDSIFVQILIIIVIAGSYVSMIGKLRSKVIPQWMKELNVSTMKIKMSAAVVTYSLISLISTFMVANTLSWDVVGKKIALHGVFLLSTYVIVKVENMLKH